MIIEKQMATMIGSILSRKKGVDAMLNSTRPLPESSMTLMRRNRADHLRRNCRGNQNQERADWQENVNRVSEATIKQELNLSHSAFMRRRIFFRSSFLCIGVQAITSSTHAHPERHSYIANKRGRATVIQSLEV